MGSSAQGVNYADLGSARRHAGRVQVRTLYETKKPTLLQGRPNPYRSIVTDVVIDCAARAYAVREIRYLAGTRGQGAVVERFEDETLSFIGFRVIERGRPMHRLTGRVCPARRDSRQGPR